MAVMALAFAGTTRAADCPPPPPCDGDPNCPLSTYAHAVIYGAAPDLAPRYYWRLGEDRDYVGDWMLGVGSVLDLGEQVQRMQPGALTCDADRSVTLSGALRDRIWQSHLVGDPDGVHAAAPGTEPFGMAVWVKPHVLDGNSRRIMGHELPDGGYFLAARNDRLSFSRYQGTGDDTSYDTVALPHGLPRDQWSFIVTTYGSDHVMRLYVDGALVAQNRSELELPDDPPWNWELGLPPDRGRLVLGASGRGWSQDDPNSQMWLEWDGGLDDAAYYQDRIPTAQDINRLWRIGTTGLDPALSRDPAQK